MPRPGTLPVWATNANYTGGPAVGTPSCVAPSGSAQAEGWEPGQKPGAQNQNWWQNLTYQWINWLAAGVLDGNWEFTGNVQIDGTTTFGADVTLTANHNVVLSGSGKYKRGTRTRKIAPVNGKLGGSAAAMSGGSPSYMDGRVQFTVDGDTCVVGLLLNDDEQLTAVRAEVVQDATMTVSMKVFATQAFTGAAQLGSTATSSTGSGTQSLSSGALTETVTAGDHKLYVVTFHATTGATTKIVLGEIEYDTIVP